jgi:transposase InsO family protein
VVGRGRKAPGVVAVLDGLVRQRGAPGHVRSDNGPEFIARAIRGWLSGSGVGGLDIEPGAPWENGYAESFHGKLRDELLEREEFVGVPEARVVSRAGKEEYSTVRPHSALGYRTPAAVASFALTPESFEATISNVIFLGGDTDTLAAMAGALAEGAGGDAHEQRQHPSADAGSR